MFCGPFGFMPITVTYLGRQEKHKSSLCASESHHLVGGGVNLTNMKTTREE